VVPRPEQRLLKEIVRRGLHAHRPNEEAAEPRPLLLENSEDNVFYSPEIMRARACATIVIETPVRYHSVHRLSPEGYSPTIRTHALRDPCRLTSALALRHGCEAAVGIGIDPKEEQQRGSWSTATTSARTASRRTRS
jgi:hypothetical protein